MEQKAKDKVEFNQRVREFVESTGRAPMVNDFAFDPRLPSKSSLYDTYSSIEDLRDEMDLSGSESYSYDWDEVEYRTEVWIEKKSKLPAKKDFRYCDYLPSPSVIQNKGISVVQFLTSLGYVVFPDQRNRTPLTWVEVYKYLNDECTRSDLIEKFEIPESAAFVIMDMYNSGDIEQLIQDL